MREHSEYEYENLYSRSYSRSASSQYLQSRQAASRQYWYVSENSESHISRNSSSRVRNSSSHISSSQSDYYSSRDSSQDLSRRMPREIEIRKKNLVKTIRKSVEILQRKNKQIWFTNFLLIVKSSEYENQIDIENEEIFDDLNNKMIRSALVDCTKRDDRHETLNKSMSLFIVFHNIKIRYENVQSFTIYKYQRQWDRFTFHDIDRIRNKLFYLDFLVERISKTRSDLSSIYFRREAIERLTRAFLSEYNNINQMYTSHRNEQWRLNEFIDKLEIHEQTLLDSSENSESEDENAHSARADTDRDRERFKSRESAQRVDAQRYSRRQKNSSSSSKRASKKTSEKNSTRRCYICKRKDHIMKNCRLRDLHDLLKKKIKKKQKVEKKRKKKKKKYTVKSDLEMSHVQFDEEKFEFVDNDDRIEKEDEEVSEKDYIVNIDEERNNFDEHTDDLKTFSAKIKKFVLEETLKNWLIDSEASSHMSNRKNLFRNFKFVHTERKIRTSSESLYIKSIKKIILRDKWRKTIRFRNVLYVSELKANLLFVRSLCKRDLKCYINEHTISFFYSQNDERITVLQNRFVDFIYKTSWCVNELSEFVFTVEEMNHILMSSQQREYVRWHRRMRHLNSKKLKNLHVVIRRLEKSIFYKHKSEICEKCVAANMRNHNRDFFDQRASQCLERIFMNICDSFEKDFDDIRYFIMILNDYNRMS